MSTDPEFATEIIPLDDDVPKSPTPHPSSPPTEQNDSLEQDRKRSLEDEELSHTESPAHQNKRQALLTEEVVAPPGTSPKSPESQSAIITPQSITMRALISTKEAGIIIGKSGKNVEEIRTQSGSRVNVSEVLPHAVERVLTISGALDTVAKAFSLVALKLASEQSSSLDVKSRHTSIRVLVPHIRMGSVIGKQGSKIKEIQDASGAKILAAEDPLPGSTERLVTISGVVDSIHIASYHVGAVLLENSERPSSGTVLYRPMQALQTRQSYVPPYAFNSYYPPPPMPRGGQVQQVQQIYIPNEAVGGIIGKGGSKINEIRNQSRCQIKIGDVVEGKDRLVTITGTPENTQLAMYLLYTRLEMEKSR
ncbi:hypothetical protein HK098_007746 [Nowakowskiella sp. JEL0407]|nr:hypothetical protein HK098_007746 [Nowakowskiella sp. JEL0407]